MGPLQEVTGYRLLQEGLFDLYQKMKPRQMREQPVVIVDIDEASIAEHGQWPWPRTLTARLVERVSALGPLAIAFDIIMPEPDRLSPAVLATEHPSIGPELERALRSLPSNDTVLAAALARERAVLPHAGLDRAQGASVPEPVALAPFYTRGPSPIERLWGYPDQVVNVPELEAAASGVGLVSTRPDADGVVRRVALVSRVGDEPAPALGLEMLRVALGGEWFILHANEAGLEAVETAGSRFATEPDGSLRLHFSPIEPERRISAAAVLAGEVQPGAFEDKVALLGVSALGLTDTHPTPVVGRMDGVEIQAQLVENLAENTRLARPEWARPIERLAIALAGVLLVVLLPRLRPGAGTLCWASLLVLIFGASFAAFARARLLVDPVYPAISTSLTYVVLLSAMLAVANRNRQALQAALERERLASARLAGELDAAREIQMGMLPDPGAVAGLPESLRLHARLEPAREVGGDLYDLFMIDERRLFFLVGDVSGKGVPASLYMALSKTVCKSIALRSPAPVGAIVSELNEALSAENPGMLFVTAVAGILDAETGELELCNAGHDPPVVLAPRAAPRECRTGGGPPLCVVDDFPYPGERVRLRPGETVVIWTDGVSEALDREGGMYGRERIVECLSAVPADADPGEIVEALYADVRRFATGAEAADDIAILAVQFAGARPKSREVAGAEVKPS